MKMKLSSMLLVVACGYPICTLAETKTCVTKDISLVAGRSDGYRNGFAFPAITGVSPGAEVISSCVKFTGLGTPSKVQMHRKSPISVNGAPFNAGPVTIRDGDELRVRMTAWPESDSRNTEYMQFDGAGFWGGIVVRTGNSDRPPKVFQVGSTRKYLNMGDVVGQLRAGDVVEVDSGSYPAVEFTRAGTPDKPIIVRGVGASRPIIAGGNWTVSFKYSDNYIFENFEVTGGNAVCLRTMANNIIVRNVYIHDCLRHGVLGADLDNGTNIFDRVEIARTGNTIPGEAYAHGLYVATDRDSFPDAVLRVQNSYFHDNKGNSIKSRAGRAEIYSNMIDVPNIAESFYSLELVGFQQYSIDNPINADVVGNVFVHRKIYGMRFGGDGTGTSKGRVRMANNTIAVSKVFAEWSAVIRLDQEFDSIFLINNAFVLEEGANFPMRLFRNGVSNWVGGKPKVAGTNNVLPVRTIMDAGGPLQNIAFEATVLSNSVVANSTFTMLDLTPLAGGKLFGSAAPLSKISVGFEIANPLLELKYSVPIKPVSEGLSLDGRNTAARVGAIGAR
jgi:hypothetical protein